MFIYKDYQLISGILYKEGIKEKKHLLWKFGGTPAIDAALWNKWSRDIVKLRFRTDKKRIFKIDKETFDNNKELINLGHGKQWAVPKEYWEIYGE